MKIDERTTQIRQVRRDLFLEGPPREDDRERFEKHAIPQVDCDLLRDLLISERAETVVEVGLAYATSALAIGEALVAADLPRPRHIIIDPYQEQDWRDAGWELMCRAGLDSIAKLIRLRSSAAFPQLVTEGLVADAAFVDGGHRFHEVFVDLCFLREIVRPGGVVIMDDYWTSSVRSAVHYFEHNLSWTPIPAAFAGGSLISIDLDSQQEQVARCIAYRLPDRPVEEPSFQDFRPFWSGHRN